MGLEEILRERWQSEVDDRKSEGEVYGDFIIIDLNIPNIEEAFKLLRSQANATNEMLNNNLTKIFTFITTEQEKALCGWTGVVPNKTEER
jgi:hypothetical protein